MMNPPEFGKWAILLILLVVGCVQAGCATNSSDNVTCLSCQDTANQYGPYCLPCICDTSRGLCDFGITGKGHCKSCLRGGRWYGLDCGRSLPVETTLIGESEMILCMIMFAMCFSTLSIRIWFALQPERKKAPRPATPAQLYRRMSTIRRPSPPTATGAPLDEGGGGVVVEEVHPVFTEVSAPLDTAALDDIAVAHLSLQRDMSIRKGETTGRSVPNNNLIRTEGGASSIQTQEEQQQNRGSSWRMGPGGRQGGGSSIAPRGSSQRSISPRQESPQAETSEPRRRVPAATHQASAELHEQAATQPTKQEKIQRPRQSVASSGGEGSSISRDPRHSLSPVPIPPPVALPKFKKGDEIRRNISRPEESVDFGGSSGAVLCGEVVVVSSAHAKSGNGSVSYTYAVEGGRYFANVRDVEALFDLA